MNAWIQAARPLAQVNIVVPMLLGHAAAWHVTRRFSFAWLVAALVWGVLDHLFVMFANDYADRDTDTDHRTILSGGSGVIVEGKLPARAVRSAAIVFALALLGYSSAMVPFGKPWTPLYGAAALLLMWLYSFPPARLSFRGGGEWLQALGMGVGLPSLGYYLQTGEPFAPFWVLAPASLLGLCSNVLTALPDAESDARADKRTWPVRHGLPAARRFASAGIAFACFIVFMGTPGIATPIRAAATILPLLPLLAGARAESPFRAAWWSSISLNLLVALWMLAMVVG